MNPAPPKPPSKGADRKALAAYYSELRRWAQALERWEAELDEREAVLASGGDYDDDGDIIVDDPDMECDCTTEDAESGCDCPACEKWRSERAKRMMQRQQAAATAGDEVQWLENLWNLPDKRRKK